ncbi:MAG: hypothetical protein A2902_03720 [Elusimicrobia bacterium RIFCSPLOWO2_01_FULL_64_13]|nr:MAG: hypothetical protein A2902_03720 [Elusimicrobia bacterium RIFCSPLOWO2_01_FULL_64_13]
MKSAKTLWILAGCIAAACAGTSHAAGRKQAVDVKAMSDSPAPAGYVLSGFEANDWLPAFAEGTEMKVVLTGGEDGRALEISYNLKEPGQWVSITRGLEFPDHDRKAVEFLYKSDSQLKNDLEIKLIDEDGTNFGHKLPIEFSRTWRKVHIDLTDFAYWWGGDPVLGKVKQVAFAVSGGRKGAAAVDLDDLRLVDSLKKFPPKIKSGLVDDCESAKDWIAEAGEGASAKLSETEGKEGKAILLSYDIGGGPNWVQISRMAPMELAPGSVFSFDLKWGGKKNVVEFKVADNDNSTFGKKFENLSNAGQWQEVRVPVSELTYWWGGNDNLDMAKVKGIWFAISQIEGGQGTVAIDKIELTPGK